MIVNLTHLSTNKLSREGEKLIVYFEKINYIVGMSWKFKYFSVSPEIETNLDLF